MNNALKLEPDDDMIYIIRSQCLIKLGRTSEAIEDAEIALKSDRSVKKVLILLLYCFFRYSSPLLCFTAVGALF